jgi:AmiR/NasT family two-component response regulator
VDEEFRRHLEAAARTAPVIEQAKGALCQYRCESPEQAFAELQYVSQQHNIKLVQVAEAVVHVCAGNGDRVDEAVLDVFEGHWPGLSSSC